MISNIHTISKERGVLIGMAEKEDHIDDGTHTEGYVEGLKRENGGKSGGIPGRRGQFE